MKDYQKLSVDLCLSSSAMNLRLSEYSVVVMIGGQEVKNCSEQTPSASCF